MSTALKDHWTANNAIDDSLGWQASFRPQVGQGNRCNGSNDKSQREENSGAYLSYRSRAELEDLGIVFRVFYPLVLVLVLSLMVSTAAWALFSVTQQIASHFGHTDILQVVELFRR